MQLLILIRAIEFNDSLGDSEKQLCSQIEAVENQINLYNEYTEKHQEVIEQLFGVESGSTEEVSISSTIGEFQIIN